MQLPQTAGVLVPLGVGAVVVIIALVVLIVRGRRKRRSRADATGVVDAPEPTESDWTGEAVYATPPQRPTGAHPVTVAEAMAGWKTEKPLPPSLDAMLTPGPADAVVPVQREPSTMGLAEAAALPLFAGPVGEAAKPAPARAGAEMHAPAPEPAVPQQSPVTAPLPAVGATPAVPMPAAAPAAGGPPVAGPPAPVPSPAEPTPSEPTPSEPTPAEPTPAESTPAVPGLEMRTPAVSTPVVPPPAMPAAVDWASMDPDATDWDSTDSASTDSNPAEPAAADATPGEPPHTASIPAGPWARSPLGDGSRELPAQPLHDFAAPQPPAEPGMRPDPPPTAPAGRPSDLRTPAAASGSSRTVAAAVAQALAVRAAAGRQPGTDPAGGSPGPAATPRGDARDRLLAVLLDDPVRAVGAAVELESCREQLDRLTHAVSFERGRLGEVLGKLAGAGLRPDQLARLAGMPLDEVRELLPTTPARAAQ